MIPKALDQIQLPDLQQLVNDNVPEGRDIEYKKDFPVGAEQDKVHFLRAVASMANSGGGDVIYGVEADNGIPVAVCGFAITGSRDAKQLQLDGWVRDCVQPRLQGIEYLWVNVASALVVLVVRVRGSWNAPHRLSLKSNQHFYGRNSAGVYPLDVAELRAAFVLSDSVGRRAEEFRAQRLMRIEAHRTPVQLEQHGIAVLHVLPVGAFTGVGGPLLQASKELARKFRLISGQGSCPDVNLDGAVHFEWRGVANRQYTQVFRNGCLEMVAILPPYSGDDLRISGHWLVKNIIESLTVNLQQLEALGVGEPLVVSLAFLGVEQYSLETHNEVSRNYGTAAKIPRFVLPDVLIDGAAWDAKSELRGVFDVLWNAFGFEKCTAYNPDGSLRPA